MNITIENQCFWIEIISALLCLFVKRLIKFYWWCLTKVGTRRGVKMEGGTEGERIQRWMLKSTNPCCHEDSQIHVTEALLTLSERCQIWDSRGTLRWIVGSKTLIRKVVNVIVYQYTSRSEESQAQSPRHSDRDLMRNEDHRTDSGPLKVSEEGGAFYNPVSMLSDTPAGRRERGGGNGHW